MTFLSVFASADRALAHEAGTFPSAWCPLLFSRFPRCPETETTAVVPPEISTSDGTRASPFSDSHLIRQCPALRSVLPSIILPLYRKRSSAFRFAELITTFFISFEKDFVLERKYFNCKHTPPPSPPRLLKVIPRNTKTFSKTDNIYRNVHPRSNRRRRRTPGQTAIPHISDERTSGEPEGPCTSARGPPLSPPKTQHSEPTRYRLLRRKTNRFHRA